MADNIAADIQDIDQPDQSPLAGIPSPAQARAYSDMQRPTSQANQPLEGGGMQQTNTFLNQIMGGLGGMMTSGAQQPVSQESVGPNISQRHGGFLTGLAGVLLDGLAGGLAPDARTALMMPAMRQEQLLKQQQMQLEQQKLQEEMREAPLREKMMWAQTQIDMLHAWSMARDLKTEFQAGLIGNQKKITEDAVAEGRAQNVGHVDTLQEAQKMVKEQHDNDPNPHFQYSWVPDNPDEQGDIHGYTVVKFNPKGTTSEDHTYNTPTYDKDGNVVMEKKFYPAGSQQGEMVADQARLSADSSLGARMWQNQQKFVPLDAGLTSFGQPIGVTAFGTPMLVSAYNSMQTKFNKDYIQPVERLAKTDVQFQEILSRVHAGKMTGPDAVNALFDAVGISTDPLRGIMRMSVPVLSEHEEARPIEEDIRQRFNKIFGQGGPITEKQVEDYAQVAMDVVRDSYVFAGREAVRQHLPVDFLPRASKPGQVMDPKNPVDRRTAEIYLQVAGGDKQIAAEELRKAGFQ